MNPRRMALTRSVFLTMIPAFIFATFAYAQEEPAQEITNSIGMKFRLIPAGSFMMGASQADREADGSEKPGHSVEISKPFYIGAHEVTQEQYERVMATNPSQFKGADRAVDSVSWDDAVEFCNKLGEMTGEKYRLPTEAEWEYACRAGSETIYYWGDNMDGDYVWHDENSGGETHPVGQKSPNAWGLYDMSGNVWEWCQDWFEENYYIQSPSQDPTGTSSGKSRVLRSGSWYNYPKNMRSSSRFGFRSDKGNYYTGFRIVREVE